MKRIYFTIFILLAVLVTLSYLYFSKLNRDTNNNEISLYAATANSGLIFSFQNDKSVLDLLSSQDLLQSLLPEETLQSLQVLQREFLGNPEINTQLNKQDIYLSFIPGENKEITYLLSTQTSSNIEPQVILNLLKAKGMRIEQLTDFSKVSLNDSTTFYFASKGKLLLLSQSFKAVSEGLKATAQKNNRDFIDYIKANFKFSKNSLAAIYINYRYLEGLQQVITPENFKRENTFAHYNYSFSKERVLFNGNATNNEPHSYQNLFAAMEPNKVTIDAILPESTANFTAYIMNNYANWHSGLVSWFTARKENIEIEKTIKRINSKYNLDLEGTFPKYFKNELLTFQLGSKEYLGAINLSNGDKLRQLLLDVSSDYNGEIKMLKEPNLLYAYFGEPFARFKKPYYIIIDNYMVFSNYASSITVFLNHYRNNRQLINQKNYTDAKNQLADQSNIICYINRENSANIAKSNLYPTYLKLYQDENKLGKFDSFIYQLSGDGQRFQSNLLLSKKVEMTLDTIPSF
ncbi:hypothetical protein [Pedobacter sp.]|uniref:hypothetical protein n=1 Tax=Pedobacter sp. TaxID=1411316 RepID=UPI003D7F577A